MPESSAAVDRALFAPSDDLTGLPDRDALERHLAAADGPASLLVIDIDHFATVTDSVGRAAADRLLAEVATRVRASAPTTALVARTGSNVFSVVTSGEHAGRDSSCGLVENLLAVLREPFDVGGRSLRISASVGVALPLAGGDDLLVDDLHRRADLALAAVKAGARGHYAVWEPRLSLQSAQRLEAQQQVRAALAQADGLTIHYQPIVDVVSRRLTAMECLVRRTSQDPAAGADGLLAAAADTGLLAALDRRVVELAQRDLPRLRDEPHMSDIRVHVNVSADGLDDVEWLSALGLRPTDGGPSASLCVEVTEHTLVATGSSGARNLERLRDAGHLVALDDFGAGYTSLATLASLPADLLKLDRSLLFDVDVDRRRRAVLAGALTLARDLGLRVVAEGVETEAQHAVLVDLGCDEAQGWLHGRPQPLQTTGSRTSGSR